MKFPLLVLFATGALSAPFFDTSSFNEYFYEDDCSDHRLPHDATSIYSYDGETINTVQGSTPDSTGLRLKALVYIDPLGACKYRMQIINSELLVKSKNLPFQTAPESGKFSKELQAQELVFQTSKGRINKLFPAAGESLQALNIKRGILSTLQLQKDAVEEVDVNGKCKVAITEENGVIIKTKDLSECSDRALTEIGLQTATLAHSKIPVKPLSSKSTCKYMTSSEEIVSVQCEENHLFRPFSAGYTKPAGAITMVKQSLKLESKKSRPRFAVETKTPSDPVSLIFGHEKESSKPDNSIMERITAVMDALVKKGSLSAKQSSAHEFVELVKLVRKLDSKRMRPVMDRYFKYESSDSDLNGVYRQFFLDALTYCGTPTCVSTVHSVIISGDVTGEYRNMFLQGISLVAKPTKQMIRDVLNIAKTIPSRQAFLSLGILINRYCKADAASCAYSKINPVTLAELFLESKLGPNCDDKGNHDRVEEMLMAIKAIGNAGQPTRAVETLVECAKTSSHMNITTAALDALRRMPCNDAIQAKLLDIYGDLNVDVEKRIQLYLTLINCPSESTISSIVRQLQNEKSSQVGSFVWSHLKNIKESSDPKNIRIQELLKGKDLKAFDLTFTKFSKAWEGSVYSKYLKSGATVNGHLIYNPDSFVPRSSLISMSANILDVPVDVFEMAARLEGVEAMVEDFFGPYGYFPDETIMNIFNVNIKKEDLEKLRSRRSVDGGYESSIKDMHEKVNKKTLPNGFLSMKVLGHEMRVFSFNDLQWAADEIDNMNVIDLLLKVAKGGHKTFTKSVMFLEMTHSVPTGLGLPLKLKLTGSAVGSLELDGKFDIRNMFWGPMALEVKGSVKPSTVVEVSGQMGIHSNYIDTGIFVNSSMFTSQVVKGSVVYQEGQKLKINVDAPEKPIEFFNISSTPFTFVNEDIKLIEGAPRRLSPDFCLNSKLIGLGLCTRLSLPVAFREYESPYFPLSGPASFGLKLVKADPKLTSYQFLVSLSKKQITGGTEMIGTFQVGTPGATYTRGLSGTIMYKKTSNVRELTIGTAEAKRNALLKFTYNNNTNRFEVNFDTDIITAKPIRARFLYFNDTSYMAKEMGMLVSANYDWYTFQHVTKIVKKISPVKSYLFHTRTTYWPKKHLTGEFEYSPAKDMISLRFDSNQFNQRIELDGKYISTEKAHATSKGFDFTLTHNSMKRISFYTGVYLNDAKKLIFSVNTATAKPVELVLGYYVTDNKREVRFDVNVLGKSGMIFIDYSNLRSGWHGMNMGVKVEEQTAGLMTSYNNEGMYYKDACIVAYINEKRPAKTCLSLKNKQLTWSIEVLKKTAAVSLGLTTSESGFTLDTVMRMQQTEIMKNIIEMEYKSLFDNEVKMTMSAGKYSVVSKFFSEPKGDDVTVFGIEGKGFGKFVRFQAKYSKMMQDDVTVRGVIFEGWTSKKLPASYTFLVETSEKMYGFKSLLKILDYSARATMILTNPQAGEYVAITDLAIEKKDLVMLGSKYNEVFTWKDGSKGYKLTWEPTVWGKTFKYGFDMNFVSRLTGSESEYALTIGTDFAKNRRSYVTAIFENSETAAQLLVDVSYLPGRLLQHRIRYNKELKKLDVSIEFLPKMFVRVSGQVNRINGWQFSTNTKLSWDNYERTMQTIAAYIDKDSMKGLNFEFSTLNQKFVFGSEYDQMTKSLRLFVTAFKKTAELLANVNSDRRSFSLQMKLGKVNVFKTMGAFGESNMVFEATILKTPAIKLSSNYDSYDKKATITLFLLGKQQLQTIGKYNEAKQSILVKFDFLKKGMEILFNGKWNSELTQLTIGTEFLGRTFGVVTRFDPYNYAAGFHFFYQNTMAGWSALYNKDTGALVYKMQLSSKLALQAVLQLIDDRIISLTLQRKTNDRFVTEMTLRYELTSSISKFAFEWNKETVKEIKENIAPVAEKVWREMKDMTKKITALSQSVSFVTMEKLGDEIMKVIREAEKRFDDFDFVAARDRLGDMMINGLTKGAELMQKGLKLTSKSLMKVHENVPKIMEKVEKFSLKVLEFSRVSMEEGIRVMKATYKSFEDITKAGLPVAKLAIKLAKEFKIRGKTTEEIVTNFIEMVQKIAKSYKENIVKQLKTIQADLKKFYSNVKIPFTDEKVSDFLERYVARLRAIDIEMIASKLTKSILEYELMGRQIKYYVDKMIGVLNNLPEEIKSATIGLIKNGRTQMKQLTNRIKKMKKYVQPLMSCLNKIADSMNKHFGPLVSKARQQIRLVLKTEFERLYLPMKAIATKSWKLMKQFVMPLIKPIRPLYEDIKRQIRDIELLERELGQVYDEYLKMAKNMITVKYVQLYDRLAKAGDEYEEAARKIASMTLEELVEKIVDETAALMKNTIESAKSIYNKRMKIITDLKERSKRIWSITSTVISVAMSRPVDDMIKISLKYAGKYSMLALMEMAKLLDQISEMDLATPLKKAWTDMDILNHLSKYGVNKKVSDLIKAAKDIKVADSIPRILKSVQKIMYNVLEQMKVSVSKFDDVIKYIKSIPKKDFETWYSEVVIMIGKSERALSRALSTSKIYTQRVYNAITDLSKKINEMYIDPVKTLYADIKQRASLVYDDVKGDCAIVYDVYRDIMYNIAKENYEMAKRVFETQYKKMYNDLITFYKKYEHQTWEEIGQKIYSAGKQRYAAMYLMTMKRYEKAVEMIKKTMAVVTEMKEKAQELVMGKGMKLFNEKVKPQALKLYKQISDYIKDMYTSMKTMSVNSYNKLVADIGEIYENNKGLSLNQLERKIRRVVLRTIDNYVSLSMKFVRENYKNIETYAIQLKNAFVKDIFPVLKEESVNIINQGLVASVLIAEEASKAFYPQYIQLQNYIGKTGVELKKYYAKAVVLAEKYYEYLREKSVELYQKGMEVLKIEYGKITTEVQKMVKKLKEDPRYQEIVRSDNFVKAEKMFKSLVEMVKKRFGELMAKIEEVKNHPKVNELKEQLLKLKEHESVKRLIEILNKMKKSLMFTIGKIQPKLESKINELAAKIRNIDEMVAAKVRCFRNDPVQCFWADVKAIMDTVESIMKTDLKELRVKIVKTTKDLLEEITDEAFKQLYHQVVKDGVRLYSRFVKLVKSAQSELKSESVKFVSEQLRILKERYAKMVAEWKKSPFYPIFANEIWAEIANEISTHEIVVELQKLAKIVFSEALAIYTDTIRYTMEYYKHIEAKLREKYDYLVKKINKFLDETTLEDIVLKTKDIREKMSLTLKDYYEKATQSVEYYQRHLTTLYEKQYKIAKSYIVAEYKKLSSILKKKYAEYEVIVNEQLKKIMAEGTRMQQEMKIKAMKMWKESSTRKTINMALKMTVGETVEALVKIPGVAQERYRDVAERAMAKYRLYLQPYVKTVLSSAKMIGNEIKETYVFVIRYYRIKENVKEVYSEAYKKMTSFLPKLPVMTKELLASVGKSSLKALHYSMVYVDNMELDTDMLKKALEKMRSFVPDVRKYVSVKVNDQSVVLSLVHPEITPSFKHHVATAKDKIMSYSEKVKTKTVAVTKALLRELRAKTMELRNDLNQSFLAHVKLSKHVVAFMQDTAKKQQGPLKDILKENLIFVRNVAKELAKEVKKTSKDSYDFMATAALEVLESNTMQQGYEKALQHSKKAVENIKSYVKPYLRISKVMAEDIAKTAREQFKKVWEKVKPYYITGKNAGVYAAYVMVEEDLRDALKTALSMLKDAATKTRNTLSRILSKEDFEALQIYSDVHSNILTKYGKRLFGLYKWNKIMIDRAIRRSKMRFLYKIWNPLKRRVDPLRTYAMIFGKRHVMTFDGKYYEFPKHPKTTCTYLLARDFRDGKFTILVQADKIIAETPEMSVSIDKSGAVEGFVKTTKAGITNREPVSGLPIENKDVTCKRWSYHIKCEFKQGIVLRVNVKHFLSTIELSGWHFGKSQGLLGTNNREIYDEMRLVNKKITNSMEQFANSWLVTKSSDCYAKEYNNQAPICNKAPSERCKELFKSSASPLARHFSQVDPLSFLKACQIDTADCDDTISYCDSVAAYRTLLKMAGIRPSKVPDCGRKSMRKFVTVKQEKAVDIVVVMSARKQAIESKKIVASMLYNTNKKLRRLGYDTRYALVSYGSATKGIYGSRSHTFNGKYFGTEKDIAFAIKNMGYTGKSTDVNDFNQAILHATQRSFRPTAARMVILFNFDKYIPSWYGPTADETKFALKYEANASLFVYDNFNLKDFQDGIFNAIGVTRKNVYMTPSLRIVPLQKELPKTPFTKFIHKSGGLFVNKLSKSTEKIFTDALFDAARGELKETQGLCRRCVGSYHGMRCRTDAAIKC